MNANLNNNECYFSDEYDSCSVTVYTDYDSECDSLVTVDLQDEFDAEEFVFEEPTLVTATATAVVEKPNCNGCNSNECAICFDEIGAVNCIVTECGHKFHSSCIFKSFANGTIGCPLCRKELVEVQEDEEDDDEDDGEYVDGEDSDDDEGDDITNDKYKISCEQMANALSKKGYTMADVIAQMLDSDFCVKNKKDTEKYTDDYFIKLNNTICDILEGEIAVDYRDKRTYAEVLKTNLNVNVTV